MIRAAGRTGDQGVAILLFLVLFAWLALQLIGLTIWAAVTYPRIDDVQQIVGSSSPDNVAKLVDLRRQWQESVLGVGTNLAITPITALLSAVVGYVLRGAQAPAAPSGSQESSVP